MTVLFIHRLCTTAGVLCPETESRRHDLLPSVILCHLGSKSLQSYLSDMFVFNGSESCRDVAQDDDHQRTVILGMSNMHTP